jgi:hypothetical protein
MTIDPFHELVFGDRAAAQADFDARFKTELDSVVADIGHSFSVLVLTTIKGEVLFPGPRYDAFALLNEAVNFLVSSLHLARQGTRVEALALLRVGVEAACVAIHLVLDADAHARYVRTPGKSYDSARSISFAKQYIDRVGEFWGALSQAAIHPNRLAFGPRVEGTGALGIRVGRQRSDPKTEKLTLTLISVASAMVLRASEVVLFTPAPEDPTWLLLVGGKMKTLALADDLLRKRFSALDAFSPKAPNIREYASGEGRGLRS